MTALPRLHVVCPCGIGRDVEIDQLRYTIEWPCRCAWSLHGGVVARGVQLYHPVERLELAERPSGGCPCPVVQRQTVFCGAGDHWYATEISRQCECLCSGCACRRRERLFARLGTTDL